MSYYVISRYFNDGSIEAELLEEFEFRQLPPNRRKEYDNRTCTQYVDKFDDKKAAESQYKECLANSSKKKTNIRPAR